MIKGPNDPTKKVMSVICHALGRWSGEFLLYKAENKNWSFANVARYKVLLKNIGPTAFMVVAADPHSAFPTELAIISYPHPLANFAEVRWKFSSHLTALPKHMGKQRKRASKAKRHSHFETANAQNTEFTANILDKLILHQFGRIAYRRRLHDAASLLRRLLASLYHHLLRRCAVALDVEFGPLHLYGISSMLLFLRYAVFKPLNI